MSTQARISKRVLVTGSNRGIGYFIARNVLQGGHELIVAARTISVGEETVGKFLRDPALLKNASNGEAGLKRRILGVVAIDLEKPGDLPNAVKLLKEQILSSSDGKLDVVIHNAGFAYHTDATEPFSLQARRTNDINYFGTVAANEALLPLISDGGRIVLLGSRAGYLSRIPLKQTRDAFADPKFSQADLERIVKKFVQDSQHDDKPFPSTIWPQSAYGISKIAVNAYATILAKHPELLRRRITINTCCPGYCQTDMSSGQGDKTAEEGADTPTWLALSPECEGISGRFWGERRELDFLKGHW
jgi:carbonyl reductase 1